jgi:hypothetical protein
MCLVDRERTEYVEAVGWKRLAYLVRNATGNVDAHTIEAGRCCREDVESAVGQEVSADVTECGVAAHFICAHTEALDIDRIGEGA